METNHHKVVIVGSGPAGLTAAIYASRANLNPIVFEGMQPGGQLTITTDIENFPGFEEGISGPILMDKMRNQAKKFGAVCEFKEVSEVDLYKKPFELKVDNKTHTADSVIIATGASAKLLGLPSEKKYMGYGVSACATCDGFFYKGLKVVVVGGGDTAMEEADYLTKFAEEVIVIHRSKQFRASKIMLDRVSENPKINFITNSVIKEIIGEEENGNKRVTGVIIEDKINGQLSLIDTDGVFIAIGHQPKTKLFEGQLMLDSSGYILEESGSTKTNIEGVFVAGDVADISYKQAITAAGSGCKAAIEAQKYLQETD